MIYTTHYHSPIGNILLAEKDSTLIGLWMEGQKYFLGSVQGEMLEKNDTAIFEQTRKWLDRYFAGEKPQAVV
ncbi:hypothetical protein D3Z36_01275 [Lachnospiraceae bacterium]|nr:hypothetical protein [Lachnospiraceae bacterium]